MNDYAINITLLYEDVESMKLDSSQCLYTFKGENNGAIYVFKT